MFEGIAASPGIEIGKVYIYQPQQAVVKTRRITADEVERENSRFDEAVVQSRLQLESIIAKAKAELGKDKAEIFRAHRMILDDNIFLNQVREKIKNNLINAESALMQIVDSYLEKFQEVEDEYLRARAADIKDIGDRITQNLLGVKRQTLDGISEEVVIVTKDLSPSDTAQMNKNMVKAFVTDMGSRTSHTAILARSLGIPAVVGLGEISSKVMEGDTIIVDGNKGQVIINPDMETLERYQQLRGEYRCYVRELCALKDLPCETKCKTRRVEIAANIGTPKDCKDALENGAEAIGLYRTEFFYMDRDNLPSEEEQYEAYKTVAQTMGNRPIVIRTLDIGGDKKLPYLKMPDELNPFLGWRAIRLCLDRCDILKTQLRAILRASIYGKLRVMYPMISRVEEIHKANNILTQAKEELDQEGIAYDQVLEVGIMVEIPSTAIIADQLAKEVDFFSIGTNDLIQYTLAVDRTNEHISHLYEPLHPAVLRLIKHVIDASHQVGIWTGMCGEMAGDTVVVPILLGMGLDEFSMTASSIPRVKKIIRALNYDQARKLANKALQMGSPEEIKKMVIDYTN